MGGQSKARHQFGYCHAKCGRKSFNCPKANLFPAEFEVRYVVFADTCLFREVELPPSTALSQPPNPFPKPIADISIHPNYGGISSNLIYQP